MGTTMEKQMDNEAISRIITKWKDQLETQYLYISQATSGYGRVYICSATSRPPDSICGMPSRIWR